MECSGTTNTVTIENPVILEATANGCAQVACYNDEDGTLVVTATGGTGDLTYSLNGGTPQISHIFTGIPAGIYTVEVVDEMGCSITTNTVTIENPTMLEATASANTQLPCYDAENGTITVSATGGTGDLTYSLNGGTPQMSNVFTGLPAGTYTVEVVDEMNCSVTTNAVIIETPEMLIATAYADMQVSCYDAEDGTLAVTATGGTGDLTYALNGGTPQISNIFTGLPAGTYTVEVVDEMQCSITTNTIIIENPVILEATANGCAQVSCYND